MLQTQKILEGKQETQGVRMRDLPSAGLGADWAAGPAWKLCPGVSIKTLEPTDSSVGGLQFTDLEHVPPVAKGCLLKKSTVTNSV